MLYYQSFLHRTLIIQDKTKLNSYQFPNLIKFRILLLFIQLDQPDLLVMFFDDHYHEFYQ